MHTASAGDGSVLAGRVDSLREEFVGAFAARHALTVAELTDPRTSEDLLRAALVLTTVRATLSVAGGPGAAEMAGRAMGPVLSRLEELAANL